MGGLVIDRRTVLGGLAALPLAEPATARSLRGRQRLAALEAKSGGRLGVAILNTATGAKAGWRLDERFPMCSTIKLLAVGAMLAKVDHGRDRLDREVVVDAAAVEPAGHAPRTRPKMFQTMLLLDLCAAAIVDSDNGALNLIVGELGGPGAVTDFAVALGDVTTRLDRLEPALNEALPGDLRDTTSPIAMLGTARRLLLGGVLRDESRDRLTGWLTAAPSGATRLRAGLPAWRVADKTGTSDPAGTANDIAVAWPAGGGEPVVIAAFLTRSPLDGPGRDAVLAAVGRIAASV